MTKKHHKAARRVAFPVRGQCDCAVCAEREQLSGVAQWCPDIRIRMVAMTFLGHLDMVEHGALGSLDLSQLFD